MSPSLWRKPVWSGLALALVLCAGIWGWSRWHASQADEGWVRANGRLQVERLDIAAKYPGRVLDVAVREGDSVAAGAVLAHEDTGEVQAQRDEAQAASARALGAVARARAEVALHRVQAHAAQMELDHALALKRQDLVSQAEVDRRQAQRDGEQAGVMVALAAIDEAEGAHQQAQAQLRQLDVVLKEMTLRAPVAGRVEYRVAEPGSVLPSGGRVLTLLDLSQTYMSIFLATDDVGRLAIGDPARVVLDAAPQLVWPATVSYVDDEAQFTPKSVETQSTRAALVYRVKLSIAPDLVQRFAAYVKPGLSGYGYVLTQPHARWPAQLAVTLPAQP